MADQTIKKLSRRDLKAMKADGEAIACSTAYDYASIQVAEQAGMDILIPSDFGIGSILLGYPTALQVTMEAVIFYVEALVRSANRAYIVAPMPFGSYSVSNEKAIQNGARLLKVGADAVKLEGGGKTIERINAMTEVGIPCFGYLGYTPQFVKSLGEERVVGDTAEEAAQIFRDAQALDQAGAEGLFLQNVPERVARVITEQTQLITIAVGGTRGCDSNMVFVHDLVGWPVEKKPLFSIQYADFFKEALAALNRHCAEVQSLEFPTEKHTFQIQDDAYEQFISEIEKR